MYIFYISAWRSWKRAGLITLRSLDRNQSPIKNFICKHYYYCLQTVRQDSMNKITNTY